MFILKLLGAIDAISAIVLMMMIFNISVPIQLILFCAFLLLLKGMFIVRGDVLSFIDIFSSIVLFTSLFFMLPALIIWIPSFLLLAKGFVSFL